MDKYTLMSRAGIWNKEVIESSHINESSQEAYSLHRMAGNIGQSTAEEFLANYSVDLELLTKAIQQGTINQYELRDVINGSAHPSKIKAFNDEFVTGSINEANRGKVYKAAKQGSYPGVVVVIENGKVIHQEPVATPDVAPATFNVMQQKYPNARITLEDRSGKRLFIESINESQWADQVPGNDEIVWVKTKEMGSKANYTPFYRGHDIDYGGHVFGSQSEMDKFVKNYILSNQMYNKLKHEPVKPIKINEVEQGETGLMVRGSSTADNNKIGDAIETLGLYGEWDREGFWFLEEEQDLYDELEQTLTKELDKQHVQNYTIEGVW